MIDKKLNKYLNNACSEQEFEDIVRWINENALSKGTHERAFKDWKSFDPGEEKDEKKYQALLDKIHHEINLKQNKKHNPKSVLLSKYLPWLSKAAAILFLPLLGVLFYLVSQNSTQSKYFAEKVTDTIEIVAPIGSRAVIELTDGTNVHLNYGSKIKYPRVFTGNTRDITLEGEGFFDVAHNPDKPFFVHTRKLNVKALGTTFNVRAYPEDETVSTSLVEGKVMLEENRPGKNVRSFGMMVPGQHAAYQKSTGEILLSKGELYKYIAWKDDKMVFDNEPITGVSAALGRKFNVDIELADEVKKYTYTVTFFNDPLFLILDLMAETTPITYKALPRKKLADGSYTKLKIMIQKKE